LIAFLITNIKHNFLFRGFNLYCYVKQMKKEEKKFNYTIQASVVVDPFSKGVLINSFVGIASFK